GAGKPTRLKVRANRTARNQGRTRTGKTYPPAVVHLAIGDQLWEVSERLTSVHYQLIGAPRPKAIDTRTANASSFVRPPIHQLSGQTTDDQPIQSRRRSCPSVASVSARCAFRGRRRGGPAHIRPRRVAVGEFCVSP